MVKEEDDELPKTAQEFYHTWIDELVKLTPYPNADFLLEEGKYTNAVGHEAENALVKSLSNEHRQVLIKILTEERTAALHNMLAGLEWWCACSPLKITYKGRGFQSHVHFHGDYIGRLQGDWPWPTEYD